MANEKNLKNGKATQFRAGEEQAKIAQKGGKASGAARREKKALKTTLESLLTMPLKDGNLEDVDKIKSLASINGKNISVQEAIALKALQKALKGDIKAFKAIADIMNQTTSESDELQANANRQSLAELLRNPQSNRNIADFEGADDE